MEFYASFFPIVAVAGDLSVVAYLTPPHVASPTQWCPLSLKKVLNTIHDQLTGVHASFFLSSTPMRKTTCACAPLPPPSPTPEILTYCSHPYLTDEERGGLITQRARPMKSTATLATVSARLNTTRSQTVSISRACFGGSWVWTTAASTGVGRRSVEGASS